MQHLKMYHLFFILCAILITGTCAFAYSGIYTGAGNPGLGFQFGIDTGSPQAPCTDNALQQPQKPAADQNLSGQRTTSSDSKTQASLDQGVQMIWPSIIIAH